VRGADSGGPGAAVRRSHRSRRRPTAAGPGRQAALERSVDAVRARFGPGAVGPGRATSPRKVQPLARREGDYRARQMVGHHHSTGAPAHSTRSPDRKWRDAAFRGRTADPAGDRGEPVGHRPQVGAAGLRHQFTHSARYQVGGRRFYAACSSWSSRSPPRCSSVWSGSS
jgi:hypothetical protein